MKEIVFDIGHEETEELLKQTEKRIENVYRQAYKELKKKSDDYMSQFLKTDAEKRRAMQAGEITKDEYRQWRQSHLLTGRRWVSMQESIAKDLNNSNLLAASIINGHLPDVYAININWATYQLEHDFKIDTSFTLYDRQTMERLLRDDPDLLPWQAKINTPEDIRYQKRHLSSAMMQGILQGETIPQISERLASSPCRMNARNAVTNARTMYTSAQNGGRIDGYKRAEGMGIHLKKQWIATLDGRTRHEHRQLDGQIVGTDENFEVDGYEIEFPGDPKAAAEMVYNCRCTMRSVLDALDKGGYTEYEKNGKLGDMSYEEWKNEHNGSENIKEIEIDNFEKQNDNDIINSWKRRKDEFDFDIEDAINAQGFDGKPKILPPSEFDEAVKAANNGNGFIAQRTYSAPDQEILDAYREQLYSGKWYVDCSTGGAQYGQGMYCAADYTGKLSGGIKNEMQHYMQLNGYRAGGIEASSETKENIIKSYISNAKLKDDEAKATEIFLKTQSGLMKPTSEDAKFTRNILGNEGIRNLNSQTQILRNSYENCRTYVETFTLDPSARIIKYNDLKKDFEDYKSISKNKDINIGSYAALRGYDAINAEGHGESGSYTVILNRTKLIIRGV